MKQKNNNKVILITGASSGIGKQTATMLIKKGHTVYGASRSVEDMQDLVKIGGHAIMLDVTKSDTISSCVKKIIKKEGHIDVLVNNAGYGLYGSIEDVDIADAKAQYDVNVFGLGEMIQKTVPYMRKQKSGLIINVASIAGKIYMPLGGWYHSSKFAVEGLSDCLRVELKPFNINVSIIEPSAIKTKFGNNMIPKLKETSEGGAYEEQSKGVAKVMAGTTQDGSGLEPERVSEKIIAAIESNKPLHRYVVGKSGKMFIFARWLLGTRIFDSLVTNMTQKN